MPQDGERESNFSWFSDIVSRKSLVQIEKGKFFGLMVLFEKSVKMVGAGFSVSFEVLQDVLLLNKRLELECSLVRSRTTGSIWLT